MINNNMSNKNIGNILNDNYFINLQNIGTNININFNQYNNSYQVINNSLGNNNSSNNNINNLELYKQLLNIANIRY